MAIAHEFESVVIRKAAVAECFPGGLEDFRARCPIGTYVEDDHLARIGSMSRADSAEVIATIERHGLVWLTDIAVTSRRDATSDCEWLTTGHINGVEAFWLASQSPGTLHAPSVGRMYWVDGAVAAWLIDEPPTDISVAETHREAARSRAVFRRDASAVDCEVQWADIEHSECLVVLHARHGRVAGFERDDLLCAALDEAFASAGARKVGR